MLSLLGAIFNERLEYKSETAADTLKKERESVFLRTKGLHFRPNVAGAFSSDFLFFSHKQSSREVGFYFAVVAPLFLFCLSFLTKTILRFSFTNAFRLTRVRNRVTPPTILLSLFISFTLPALAQSPPLTITHLTGGCYICTTYQTISGAPFPSNGMYLVTNKGVVLLDGAWDSTQYQPLLDSIYRRHHQKVVLFIATHFHNDRTAEINFLRQKGIPTYCSALTYQLCRENKQPLAEHVFENDTAFQIGGYTIRTYYPGPGHTRDNIVVWFAADSVLYGGCLVKSTENTDLGYLADANLGEWPGAIRRLLDRYPHAAYVIPGHFGWSDNRSLQHTLDLLKAQPKSP